MILEIEDYYGNTICGLHLRENNNEGFTEVLNTIGKVSIADIDFDNIFNTNEYKLRIQLEETKLNDVETAENIVKNIRGNRGGQGLIYDEEILEMYVDDYFEYKKEAIKKLVDFIMERYVDENSLEIL